MRPTILSTLFTALCVANACGAAGATRPQGPPPGDPLAGTSARELFERGIVAARYGDTIRAEQYFAAAQAKGYPEARVVPAIVRACINSSRLRTALGHALPYLDRHPETWSLRFVVAGIYLALGEPLNAREHLARVAADRPNLAETYYWLGQLARADGDTASARDHFTHYLALAPSGSRAAHARRLLAPQSRTAGAPHLLPREIRP